MKSVSYGKLIKLLKEAIEIIKAENEPGDITITVGHKIEKLIDELIENL